MPVGLITTALGIGAQIVKANGARKAANEQKKGIEAGKSDINTDFDKAQTYQDPYVNAGNDALNRMSSGTKVGGEFDKSFGASDFTADPGYGFRQSEGLKAVDQGAAARGGVLSGAALKAEQEFGQSLASQEYQSAYSRFNNDMNSRFDRLGSIVTRGQHASDISTNSEQQRGTMLSNLSINKGNVLAAKELSYANAGANTLGLVSNSIPASVGAVQPDGASANSLAAGSTIAGYTGADYQKWLNSQSGGSTSYGDK